MNTTNAADQPQNIAVDVAGVVDGSNRFALDLYQQLRPQDGNLFFSPSSITTALAMVYTGAAGDTETQMAQTLHFQMPPERLHRGMHTLQRFAERKEPPVFRADHPFVFLIRDNRTQAILFLGRIINPIE